MIYFFQIKLNFSISQNNYVIYFHHSFVIIKFKYHLDFFIVKLIKFILINDYFLLIIINLYHYNIFY